MRHPVWAPPSGDHLSHPLAARGMPATLAGCLRRVSALSIPHPRLALPAFLLATGRLETQRRIVVLGGNVVPVLWLGGASLSSMR